MAYLRITRKEIAFYKDHSSKKPIIRYETSWYASPCTDLEGAPNPKEYV